MRLPFLENREEGKQTDGSASFLRAARAGNLEKVLEFLKTNTDINTCNANGLNALHLASKEGHVNVVRELLQRGANVDAATKKGNTALHIASLAGQEEIVKVLVQHQALVNIQSQNGFTPLYMAAQENHDSVVRFLLANNANQSLATEDGFTPLAVALQQGHDKVVAVLLENDTRGKVRLPALHIAAKKDDTKAAALLLHTDHNPDVTSKSGFTPLHIASHYGNENIANLLIQRGADVNYIAKHQITPLHVASKWGKGNMVSLLIDKGANYEAKTRDGLTPLHCAARSGHEAVVDMLLEKGAPITSKTKNGLAPLHMASQGDHVDAARILLYHKAPVDDVTVDFLTALHVAAHCGHVRVAKLLLDRKADPNARALNGFTPLHIACKKNRIKVVELLLKHGASIEATTESGLTPLHVASFMGCMNIVIYLLQHSAIADVPTVRGETPLHLAARANQTDIIRILLRNGAQVDARAREQQTALHIASRLGNSDIVVLLLQHGAAVDATTKDHYTALHIAAKEGQEEVASVLLEHGASLTSTTKKGFTPLHLAAKYGNMKVARLLLQKDAPVDAQGKNGVTPLHVAAHYDHQNVALLLLDKGASPHATAKNGYTPLHIASRKNQMDIATTLLEYGASANAESKAGFTPLHLSSQEGHTDMATLLIEHNAAAGACAKNGLTPLHLCGQEDRVNVAAILVKHGAQIDPATKAGYTPLHVACHFGQMNMVRFLLQHGAKVNSTTQLGYTPLHQAAQQGHTQIVNLLLENKAEPNTETNDGKTALSIAQRLGYISVVETLKIVTETTINTTTTTVTEEKYKVVVPETMHETFMSESEDEGGDDTMLGDQSYRYLTVDEMKSLGDDSLPIDVTKDEKMDMSFSSNTMAAPPVAPADQLSPQHQKEHYAQMTASYPADNVDVGKAPILAGPESLNTTLNTTIDSAMIEPQIEPQVTQDKLASQCQQMSEQQMLVQNNTDMALSEKATEILNGWEGFLVSFMVDARGGAMRGCRHSGVRVIIPPRKAAMPMRVTCRYLKKDKLVHAPPLMEGEALGSCILEMGPAGAKFLGPVIIEVPHFASLRGKEREIVILRSDNGETWREHTLEATEEAVQEVLNESFDGEELKQLEDLNTNRITRILTTDFPQYFAIVTRIRQEVHAIGPEGGMVSSTVVPQVQAVFPQGALTKKIKVGLQAQPIPTDLVAKLLGNRVAVSPIVTVEPRRRKFHKPITLTIPVPQASSKGMINQYSGEAPTLRLLCSITGGTTRAQWEDVTGSTPLTFVNDCVSFTTTVSARFWLMDCSNIPEATKMATELYREAIHVPFMAKFVVFSKRHQLEEARMRVFCMTDDREDKTLEQQELFVEVAKSRDVEVLEGKPQFLEFAGNLVPVTKSGDQLAFNFYAFRENRLPFTVRVKDQHADPIGRVAFMRQPKVGRGDPPQTPICNLNIALPDNIQPEPAPSEPDLLALEKKYSFLSISKADTIHRASLRLTDISNMLGTDWVALAHELEISDSDINIIRSQYPDNAPQQATVMLRLWMQTAGNKATGNTVGKCLRKIDREDIVKQCIFNVEVVTDDIERAMAKAHLDQSGFEAFKDELGPSRDATLNRDVSLDVSYDEQDMMKEAESAEEEEENQRAYHDKSSREQHTADLSPTYESEEKKYAGEEKVVTDEKVTKEEAADDSTTFTSIPATSTPIKKEDKLERDKTEKVPESVLSETPKDKPVSDTAQDTKAESSQSKILVKDEIEVKEPEKKPEKEEDKAQASQKEPEKVVTTTTTKTEVIGGPGEASTVTTESKTFTTADDGTVQEHIIVKKQTTKVTDGKEMEEDKSTILQKLGEELGKLDEQLEEKFKKRKAEKPEVVQEEVREEAVVAQRREGQTQPTSQVVVEHGSEPTTLPATTTATTTSITPTPDGFTQASVESSQMSSTRGTADVSFPGADKPVMQLDGALTQQMVPRIDDGRISHEDPSQRPSYGAKEHPQDVSTSILADPSQSSRTEERGCSPITVLEARHNAEQALEKLQSRGSSHTITTTTSWGCPLSATTNIQIEDENSPHCLQFTLHSESRVTLHAPEDVIQELQHLKQHHKQMHPETIIPPTLEGKHSDGDLTEQPCEKSSVLEESLGKTRDTNTHIDTLKEVKDIETQNLKHSSDHDNMCRQIDYSDAASVNQVESIPSEVVRVEESSVVEPVPEGISLSLHETIPRKEGDEEARVETIHTPESHDDGEVSVVLGDDQDQATGEVTASSAHRPTTLMITSNSNESSDDAECTTNDPSKHGRENDTSQEPKEEESVASTEESKQEAMDKNEPPAVGDRASGNESGAVPRLERSVRSSPRTTTFVKVKVEKRPVGSHSQVRERNSHDHLTVVRAPSMEEEVRGLMQEVKEATSQIKQEVKELRQADTPTPDTPTPLREFKEFLNREEEQELERLPTIKEMCRESEEDPSAGMGGEHTRGNEYLCLRPNTPVHEPSLPEQLVQPGFDDKSNPDSGYSTMEGYYAKSVDPSQTAKYTPSRYEMVPEGSFDSELESPSSPVDIKCLPPVASSVGSALLTGSEKQSKSKLKSFLKKVCKLTSKGNTKYETRISDDEGEHMYSGNSHEQNLLGKGCILDDGKTSGMVQEKREEIHSQIHGVDNVTHADSVTFELNRFLEREKAKVDQVSSMSSAPDDSVQCLAEKSVEKHNNFEPVVSETSVTPVPGNVLSETDQPTHYVSTTSVTELHFTEHQIPHTNETEAMASTSGILGSKSEQDVCSHVNEETEIVFSRVPEDSSIGGTVDDDNFTRYYENLEYSSLSDNFQVYESGAELTWPGTEEMVQQTLEKESFSPTESELSLLKEHAHQSDCGLPEKGILFSDADYVSNSEQTGHQGIGYTDIHESANSEETVSGSSISVPLYTNTFPKIEEEYEERTSFNQHTVMIPESSMLRQSSKTKKLSALAKFSISEEDYDDYIDLPDTDVVEIMETVIEVDETEESDEMHQEETSLKSCEEHVSLQEKYAVERDKENFISMQTWKAKKRKKEPTGNFDHEEEIQLLSEADIQIMNESLQSLEVRSSAFTTSEGEDKVASSITCLPQHQDKEDIVKLYKSSITDEALVLETDVQEVSDETTRADECKSEAVDRTKEITEHILKQIDSMDVGNRRLTDLGSEGDIDFMFDSGHNILAPRETDSEMEMSFSDDFPVRVPELNETDSWLKTIKAYQSMTAKPSETKQDPDNGEGLCEVKHEDENVPVLDYDWVHFMKMARSSSCHESKNLTDGFQVKSVKTPESSVEVTRTTAENVVQGHTSDTAPESKSSNVDHPSLAENANQQYMQTSESIGQSPYKLCMYEYIHDGHGLQLKGIVEDEKPLPSSHDIASVETVNRQTDSPDNSSYKESDHQNKGNCVLSENKVETQSHYERNDAVTTSVTQEPESFGEADTLEDSMLAVAEECSEMGISSVKCSQNDLCSSELSTVELEFPAISDTKKTEAVVDSRMKLFASEDTRKDTTLSHVSEELKAMITDLEHSLVAGEAMHLEIGPLIERLDEMEKEMVELDIEHDKSESSIPVVVDELSIHDVVSTSQTSPPTEEVKMPVGLEKDAATLSIPGAPSPSGDMNGDIQEAVTDIEDLHSEGDVSPIPKRKTLIPAPKQDAGALTDTEDMDISGEEDDIIPEEKDLPTLQAMGLLPDPVKEVINLTEGYAREPSPLYGSDSEVEKEDVQGRHRKNIAITDKQSQITPSADDDVEGLTDVEDMVASGDEEIPDEVEDSLPDYYMAQGEDVSNKENYKPQLPTPKILITKKDDSSDDETPKGNKGRTRHLRVEVNQEATTDVEDLDVSDKDVNKEPSTKPEVAVKEKVRRKKQVRKKASSQKPSGKALTAPKEDSSGHTDVEILTGDEEKEEDTVDLTVPEEGLEEFTDTEDVEASDTETVEDLVSKPVEKEKTFEIPEPHRERIKISDVEEEPEEESGAETDEEGFELNEKEDERPLVPRKRVTHEPLDNDEQSALEVEEADEAVPTDTEDFDIEEKEEKEVIDDMMNRVPEETEIYTLTEMEENIGKITKKEMLRDVNAELKQKIKDAERCGITIQTALEEECLTDVEDLDAPVEVKEKKTKKAEKADYETSEESVTESDIEEEIVKPSKSKRRGKRLPIAPQLSEVRFVETESGPLSIVITPDSKIDEETVENVKGIVFIESENDEAFTDVEEISDGEGDKIQVTTTDKPDPVTDTEDLDFDPSEVDRPRSPLPPHLKYDVLQSPKRELVYIKEDKHGVPQVTVRKLRKDELFVSDIEESGATDTEDIEVSEEEALRLAGATTDATSDFELSDSGNIIVSSMTADKPLKVEGEEDANTDVEELILSKKPQRKAKVRSKLIPSARGEDSHTDVEFLSDNDDKGKLSASIGSPNSHTDVEDFEQSDVDVEDPDRYDTSTPDIIRDAAIKKMIIAKEGPDGTTYTEDAAVVSSSLLGVDVDPEGTTDVEDFEVSGAEDELHSEHPAVNLPEYEASSVDISERSSVPSARNEEKHVKDNLLLPEDNFNNITDVESLGEGEGNRCASNTSLLSGQQLTCAVESCSVDELPYPSPATDPKLCIHPGFSLESDPFCSELTNPLVVEAELEQVYYHTPQDRPEQTEMELEAHNGCVIRRRQVVASMYQAREIRRFWSQDRNTPLHQSEIGDFASPVIHKKDFKTILYLEQPNLLDTISISDTLCDPDYFRNERLLDFDSSSDSFDDHLTFKDSDAATVIGQLDTDKGSSFDDLPSPHLSSISSSLVGSMYSGRSFSSDPQLWSFCSTPLLDTLVAGDLEESLQDRDKSASFGSAEKDTSIHTSSLSNVSLNKNSVVSNTDVDQLHGAHFEIGTNAMPQKSEKYEIYPLPFLDLSSEIYDRLPKTFHIGEYSHESNAANLADPVHYNRSCVPKSPHLRDSADLQVFPHERLRHDICGDNTLAFTCGSQKVDSDDSICKIPSFMASDTRAESVEKKHVSRNLATLSLRGSSMDSLMPTQPTEMSASHTEPFKSTEQLRWNRAGVISESQDNYVHESFLYPSAYESNDNESVHKLKSSLDMHPENLSAEITGVIPTLKEEKPLLSSRQVPRELYENINIPAHHTMEGFIPPFNNTDKQEKGNSVNESFVADCHLKLEETEAFTTDIHAYHDDFSPTVDSSSVLTSTMPTCTHHLRQNTPGNTSSQDTRHSNPTFMAPLLWRHTLPRMCRQLKNSAVPTAFKKDIPAESFVGVRNLIDQWEEIVEEEKRRSLPVSPAIGRKVMPPFEEKKYPCRVAHEAGAGKLDAHAEKKVSIEISCQKGTDGFQDSGSSSVIEEVASVGDIIQQFEGKFGQGDKLNIMRQKAHKAPQSPSSRSSSHPRQVATVKPLREFQQQEENQSSVQNVNALRYTQESMEGSQMAGFVPRVMEPLSITKSSEQTKEEEPPIAGVLNPEGTHEASQPTEQQTSLPHEEGLEVEEMSSVMESYASDGNDPITTTHITRYDPDPLPTTTSTTTTTTTTRVIRRTKEEDGEVKEEEEMFEEY